ncbi:MAG: glycosyltransferase family 4 protein [Isosphaeraceae bacterium]
MTGGPVWHLLTGEYPPIPGGVGDYTALLAAGLAETGADVHVWTTQADGPTPAAEGVTVHRERPGWSPDDLKLLGESLDAFPKPRRFVVQYAPNAWGYKGLNLGFCRWVLGRAHAGDEVRVMFHEVAYPFEPFGKPTRWVLAAAHRVMARTLMKASTYVDVSIPAWEATLRRCAPEVRLPIGRRPVPSNIPVVDDPDGVAEVRRRVAPGGEAIVGSFSSFSSLTGPLLSAALPKVLLGSPGRVGLLIGHGGDAMAARLSAAYPELKGRILATGAVAPADVSRHLQACDLAIQTYPDGVTGRRGSVMALLAHGVPVATNRGRLSEAFWAESAAVSLAPEPQAGAIVRAAEALLADPAERERVGAAGRDLHERRFAIGRTVEALVGLAPQASS